MAFAQLYLCCWLKCGSRQETNKNQRSVTQKGSRTSKAITEGGIFVCDKNLRKTSTQTCQFKGHCDAWKGVTCYWFFMCFCWRFWRWWWKQLCFVVFYDSRSFQICATNMPTIDSWWISFCWGFSYTAFKWEWSQSPSGSTSLRLVMQKSPQTKRMKKTHAAPKIKHKKQQKWYRKASMWQIL